MYPMSAILGGHMELQLLSVNQLACPFFTFEAETRSLIHSSLLPYSLSIIVHQFTGYL